MPLGDPMTQNGHEDYPVLSGSSQRTVGHVQS